jgi:transposase
MKALTKAEISILHCLNLGIRSALTIHRKTDIPLSTIKYNLKNFKETKSLEHRGGNDRPRRIIVLDNVSIRQYIRRNNEITLKEIQEKLSESRQTFFSISTISRHLLDHGYHNVLPINTPMLANEQKRYRIQCSRAHMNDDWTRTVFTDESSFQLFRNTIRRWSKTPENAVKRKPKNRRKVHIWGAIGIKCVIDFYTFRRNLHGDYFVDILQHHLVSRASRVFKRDWRLQQNNDPKHRSGVAKKFISERVPELLEWPSNSPDLNPIENYWTVIKRRVEKRKSENTDELEQHMNEEMRKTKKSFLINFISSVKDRCLAVISSSGERIKF